MDDGGRELDAALAVTGADACACADLGEDISAVGRCFNTFSSLDLLALLALSAIVGVLVALSLLFSLCVLAGVVRDRDGISGCFSFSVILPSIEDAKSLLSLISGSVMIDPFRTSAVVVKGCG